MLRQPLQYEQRVPMLLLQSLKRIGAVRRMHRRRRDIVSRERLQILAQVLLEGVLAVRLRRDVTGVPMFRLPRLSFVIDWLVFSGDLDCIPKGFLGRCRRANSEDNERPPGDCSQIVVISFDT